MGGEDLGGRGEWGSKVALGYQGVVRAGQWGLGLGVGVGGWWLGVGGWGLGAGDWGWGLGVGGWELGLGIRPY